MMLSYSLILKYETKKLKSSAIKANWSGVWGKGILGRMDTFIYMAESLRCSHGTTTTLNRLCVCVCVCVCVCKVTQSCPTLCNPMDCSPPGPSVHGISQTRILEWVAISFARVSSQPRDQTRVSYVSCIGRPLFTTAATWEAMPRIQN